MTDLQSSVTLAGHFLLCRTKRSGCCLMGLWICGVDGYGQIPLPMTRWLAQIALVGPGGPLDSHKAVTGCPVYGHLLVTFWPPCD